MSTEQNSQPEISPLSRAWAPYDAAIEAGEIDAKMAINYFYAEDQPGKLSPATIMTSPASTPEAVAAAEEEATRVLEYAKKVHHRQNRIVYKRLWE